VRLKQHIRRAGEAKATHPRAASGCAPLGAPSDVKEVTGEAEVALALGCAPLGAPLCHENLNSYFQGFILV